MLKENVPFLLKLPKALHKLLKKRAESENRSLHSQILTFLESQCSDQRQSPRSSRSVRVKNDFLSALSSQAAGAAKVKDRLHHNDLIDNSYIAHHNWEPDTACITQNGQMVNFYDDDVITFIAAAKNYDSPAIIRQLVERVKELEALCHAK